MFVHWILINGLNDFSYLDETPLSICSDKDT